MFRWVPYAMVRIAAFFIAGILLGIYQADVIPLDWAYLLLGLLVLLYLTIYIALPKARRSVFVGAIGLTAIFFVGYAHLISFVDWKKPNHLSNLNTNISYYTAEVLALPQEKQHSLKYSINIIRVNNGDGWINTKTKALLYIRKEPGQSNYFYKDKILVKGTPQLLAPPQNPHEFDFKRFLSYQNIYYQQFARQDQVQLVSTIETKDLKYYSFVARQWAAAQLKKQLSRKKEQSIALALTLGVTDGIDNELQSAYAASGAMHVLAVSGLHVGILYGMVLLLFRPIKNLSWSRWLIAIASLLILWSFAFITGLSPSVLRAVTMFSFVALAKPFGRSSSIYNTLACSAFLLLLFDPFLIMSVGFQLSYLAVLGIVSIHRPLYQWWEPKSAVLDWVWNITCVSIAAQLATFSLGILYFHQFPVYFLFSNLFVIPGAIAVLVTSILVILTSAFSPLTALLGKLLQGLIQLLNYGVFTFEQLPFSLINDIYFTTLQCWLLILALGFLLMTFYRKEFSMLLASLVFVAIFSGLQWHHFLTEVKGDRFIVYNIPGHVAVEWISNGHSYFYADAGLINDSERIRFHIRPNRLFCGVKETEINFIDENGQPLVFMKNGKRIGMITESIISWPPDLKLDYLVMGNNSFKSLATVKNTIKYDLLILDSSNNYFLANRIKNEQDDEVYSVQHERAYVEKFSYE